MHVGSLKEEDNGDCGCDIGGDSCVNKNMSSLHDNPNNYDKNRNLMVGGYNNKNNNGCFLLKIDANLLKIVVYKIDRICSRIFYSSHYLYLEHVA